MFARLTAILPVLPRRTLLRLALLLGFALGQCATLLHYAQHEMQADDDVACQICGIADDLGGMPTDGALPLPALPQGEAPATIQPRAALARLSPRPLSTGPPRA